LDLLGDRPLSEPALPQAAADKHQMCSLRLQSAALLGQLQAFRSQPFEHGANLAFESFTVPKQFCSRSFQPRFGIH
jgi:hypothetical protein